MPKGTEYALAPLAPPVASKYKKYDSYIADYKKYVLEVEALRKGANAKLKEREVARKEQKRKNRPAPKDAPAVTMPVMVRPAETKVVAKTVTVPERRKVLDEYWAVTSTLGVERRSRTRLPDGTVVEFLPLEDFAPLTRAARSDEYAPKGPVKQFPKLPEGAPGHAVWRHTFHRKEGHKYETVQVEKTVEETVTIPAVFEDRVVPNPKAKAVSQEKEKAKRARRNKKKAERRLKKRLSKAKTVTKVLRAETSAERAKVAWTKVTRKGSRKVSDTPGSKGRSRPEKGAIPTDRTTQPSKVEQKKPTLADSTWSKPPSGKASQQSGKPTKRRV